MDWNTIFKHARIGTTKAVNDWIAKAQITGGRVQGSAAIVPPGSLKSPHRIEPALQQYLTGNGVPSGAAAEIAKTLNAAWDDWANGFSIRHDSAYPRFQAVAAAVAPLAPAVPLPVRSCVSTGEAALLSTLATNLSNALRLTPTKDRVSGPPDAAIQSFAEWVGSSFRDWSGMTMIVGLHGRGNVPTYAPPYVPVGPVIRGDNITIGHLFAGPPFGRAF